MRINGVGTNYINKSYGKNKINSVKSGAEKRGDHIKISEIGKRLSKIESLQGKDREKLIVELREKIQKGEYRVDSREVAEKLLMYMKNKEV